MEIFGIHLRRCHIYQSLGKTHGVKHMVTNHEGDLDAYVVQFDHTELFKTLSIQNLWNEISARVWVQVPFATSKLQGS